MDKIVLYAQEGLKEKDKKKTLEISSISNVNYKNFLLNLVNFRYGVKKIPPACPPPVKGAIQQEEDGWGDDDQNEKPPVKKVDSKNNRVF